MDSPLPEGFSQDAVRRWALLVALLLPAAAGLGEVAHGKDRSGGADLWQGGQPAPASGGPLIDTHWYPPAVSVYGARRNACAHPFHRARRHASRHRRLVALTFDDGPSSYTRAVVRSLGR